MTDDETVRDRIANHRDALETIADSDLPANWIAETLIEIGGPAADSSSREESHDR